MQDRNRTTSADFVENDNNPSNNPHLSDLLQVRLSRRTTVMGGLSATAAAMFASVPLVGCGSDSKDSSTATPALPKLGFTPVARSLADTVMLPTGYSLSVLYALGDPLAAGVADWADNGSETGASYEKRSGDHHDAMAYYGLGDDGKWASTRSDRGVLCINHENITQSMLHAGAISVAPRLEDEALKEINAHGVAILEIKKNAGKFEVVRTGAVNRRITPNTPMELTGPVRGSRFTVTAYDAKGVKSMGTINNCGHGETPWGTYLSGEENWAFYYQRLAGDNAKRPAPDVALLNRYGITEGTAGSYAWASVVAADPASNVFKRWNASVTGASLTGSDDFRHDANTFGWVVEIDPFNAASTPKKRTALGRMAHEGAWFGPVSVGKPIIVYTGDDSRNEYIYKFVSEALWDAADAAKGTAAGDKYLDKGTLYVGKFKADGTGEWVALVHGLNGLTDDNATFPFTSQAAVLVAARLAGDAVGATKMDRPEWCTVNPLTGEVYFTLTNNSRRVAASPTSSNPMVDAANPRYYEDVNGAATSKGNVNGHIIRWREDGSNKFSWDIYLFGAQADANLSNVNVSGLSANNDFSSPDGIYADPRGVLWIQTDDGAYSDVTNCMMLAAVPGMVGDGGKKTIQNTAAGGAVVPVDTFVGKNPGDENLRRFLVGPKECEITGLTMTPDGKTMFVNIQHPGENSKIGDLRSHWPDSQTNAGSSKRPRSATIVITRNDGGVIGLV